MYYTVDSFLQWILVVFLCFLARLDIVSLRAYFAFDYALSHASCFFFPDVLFYYSIVK